MVPGKSFFPRLLAVLGLALCACAQTDLTGLDASASRDVSGGGFDAQAPGQDAARPDAGSPVPADAGSPDVAAGLDASAGPDASPTTCDGVSTPSWVTRVNDSRFAFRCGATYLEVSVVDEGTLRLRYQAEGKPERSWAVVGSPKPVSVRAGGPEDTFGICLDAITLEVRVDCRLKATQSDGTVVLEEPPGEGYFEDASGLRGVRRALHSDEHYYGLGEKTGPLDKLGLAYSMRNTDAFDSQFGGYPPGGDPLYQSIPFYIGLREDSAYGLFTDNSFATHFDLGAADPTQVLVSADGGFIDQYLFAGPTMGEVLRRYTGLTGRMPLPARWTLGYHQSRWGYSPDTEVTQVCQEFRTRNIPADGIWLDIQHMDGFRDFTWDPKTFPDPSGLVSQLSTIGFKTVAIVDPGIKVDPAWSVYTQGVTSGRFILGADGNGFVGQVWPGDSVFPDFSAASTRTWWGGLLAPDLGLGVRGLWIDMNEPTTFDPASKTVPDSLPVDGDGQPTTMAELHNAYALMEARATYEGMKAAIPSRRPFILTRAGFAGEQRYAAVWTGDAPSSWQTLNESLPTLLNLGLSGVPFVGTDVGGYAGKATSEMFARWMQFGAVSPFFRGHTADSGNRQEPWVFGTEVEDISRAEIQSRYQLLPYLYSLFYVASTSGAPVLRPLVYDFAADPATRTLGDEVMLGPSILIAPVLVEGATTRSVYLPAGRWFELLSGAVHDGPVKFDQGLTLAARPSFVREGAIIPRAEFTQWIGQRPLAALELDVYPAARPTSFALYEDDGDGFDYSGGRYSRVIYTLQGSGSGATLTASPRDGQFDPGARKMLVRVRRVDHAPGAVALDGKALLAKASEAELQTAGLGYFYDAADLSLLVAFQDRPGFSLTLLYDPTLAAPAPSVPVTFEVTVPADTPSGASICVASSANNWQQSHLEWIDPGKTAAGTLTVPRGEWFLYKYTRCDWSTVEKWAGCVEASNRYGFGAAHPTRTDAVAIWADQCP